MKFIKVLKYGLSFVLHLTAVAILAFAFRPIAVWYINHRPILGVDFFNTVTHVKLFANNFDLPPWAYRYFWFGGSPLYSDFAIGWYYPILVVSRFLPLISAVRVSMLASIFLFFVFSYLAFERLGKNHILAAALAVMVIYSPNLYGSLTWGGSLPYFATQLFFPLVLWILASYLDTGKKCWFWAAVLASGLAILGHAKVAGTFVLTSAMFLLLFGLRKEKTSWKTKVYEIGIFLTGSVAISYRVSMPLFTGALGAVLRGKILNPFGAQESRVQFGEGGVSVQADTGQALWEQSQFGVLFSDTNQWLLVLVGMVAAVFLVALVLDRQKKQALKIVPWGMLAGFSILHVFLNSYGIPFLEQGWYRAFWHFPITLAVFLSAVVGYSVESFSRASQTLGRIILVSLAVVGVGLLGLVYRGGDLARTIEVVERKSSPSSAYPEAVNLVEDDKELESLKSKLTPEWLDITDRNWRIYESDAQVNVWWNSLFDMPLVRGYIDPPIGTDKMGQIFLADQAVGANGLVDNFNYQEEVARNMALYYMDWNAMRYFEGGHVSISDNKAPSSYLEDAIAEKTEAETVGLYRLYETESGKPEIMDIPQWLVYYRFKDELVTPVLSQSKAPALMCFCDWPAYEALLKSLSMNNINSRVLVTAYSEKKVDSFSVEELSKFDVVYMAGYRYGDQYKTFDNLSKYVSSGGRLFIDTGGEVNEAESISLPQLFPFAGTIREGLGTEWELEAGDNDFFAGVDLDAFSPPVFDGAPWKLSYPRSEVESADVLLRQQDNPILARWQLGEGEVVWSGMNLAYHVHANTNVEESELLIKLLESLVSLEEHEIVEGIPNFVSSREIGFQADGEGKGILLKQQFYPGWRVKLNGVVTRAYKAGPAYPGYVYVPIDQGGQIEVHFKYWGRINWYIQFLFSLAVTLVILDLTLLGGRLVGNRIARLGGRIKNKVGHWWEKEEEY